MMIVIVFVFIVVFVFGFRILVPPRIRGAGVTGSRIRTGRMILLKVFGIPHPVPVVVFGVLPVKNGVMANPVFHDNDLRFDERFIGRRRGRIGKVKIYLNVLADPKPVIANINGTPL